MTRTMKAAAAIATLMLALAACGSGKSAPSASGLDLVKAGALTVCSDVPYPPFEDFDKSAASGFKGFDIDIDQAIADGLKLKLDVKDSSFDGLQSGQALNSGQCDLASSAMTITPEREKNIDFSTSYYDSKQSLLVPKGSSIKSIKDLAGKTVGVQQGTTGKSYTQKHAPKGTKIPSFPSDAEMYQAIQAGQVDALLQDLPVNLEHTKKGKFVIVEKYDTNESYGLAIKKGNAALLKDVNAQLAKLKSSGEYQKLYDKYFTTR
ncbi:MAG: ABC transporter substrate-binding protein [Aeromicrobium sp.]